MEVLSKEEIDKLLQPVTPSEMEDVYDDEVDPCDAAFVDGLLNSINFAEEQKKLKAEEVECGKLSKMSEGFDAAKGIKGGKALSEVQSTQPDREM